MTHLFNLWNLFESGHGVCEFDVTAANLPRIKDGSREFITACLEALSVQAAPQQWTITPFRSYYLSDYIGPKEEWVDRWYPGWSVRVALTGGTLENALCPYDLPIYLEAFDSTWASDYFDPRHDTTALLVSIHKGHREEIAQIGDELIGAARRSDFPPHRSQAVVQSIQNGLQQLRILFEGVNFPTWTRTGEAILQWCQERGGVINYRHL